MDVTVLDMMNARDRRAEKQRELLGSYGQTLLCFTMNIPGPEKDNALIRRGFALGRRRLRQGLLRLGVAPVHAEARVDFTGCEAFYVLAVPPLTAKRMACDIEEADALGRLFDMDVLRPDGGKVERREIGLPGRKCLLCGETAQVCARARTHTVAELRARTAQILREAVLADKCETVARLACTALMHEVLTTPKPGLVWMFSPSRPARRRCIRTSRSARGSARRPRRRTPEACWNACACRDAWRRAKC